MTDRAHNGQPPLPPQPPPPNDPRSGPSDDQKRPVCRKYVWGTCNKYNECKFRHELIFEEMKGILRFCHDHQNKSTCTRPGCTYLHTSSDEENLFLTTGVMPRVLVERHIAMNAASHKFMNDMYASALMPPPPPPPPAAPPPTPTVLLMPPSPRSQPSSTTPMPAQPVQHPRNNNLRSQAQHTHYSDEYNTQMNLQPMSAVPGPSTLNIPTQMSLQYAAPDPSPHNIPIMFDTSRPPPPLPQTIADTTGNKRKTTSPYEARPAKSTRSSPNRQCLSCVQLDTSLSVSNKTLEDLISVEADLDLEYKEKSDVYETKKRLVLSLLNPDHRRSVEEFIEGVPSDFHNNFGVAQNRAQQNLGNASVKEVFIKLLDFALDESRRLEQASALVRNVEDANQLRALNPTGYQDEGLMQLLRAANNTIASSPALGQQLHGIVQNYPIMTNEKQNHSSTSRPSQEMNHSNTRESSSNGYYHNPVAGPSTAYHEQPSTSQAPPPRPPAPSYPAYHPAMPPPSVQTYGQYQYHQTQGGSHHMAQHQSAAPQRPPPPPQQHPPPPQQHPPSASSTYHSNQNMSQHYYPPYQ